MKTVVLAVALVALAPAPLLAQRYDYHPLLGRTAQAAADALIGSGHRAGQIARRPDGMVQRSFTIALPDSNGDLSRGELQVAIVSQGDSITRIGLRADSHGADSVNVVAATHYFVGRLTTVLGRPVSVEGDTDWCWSTRQVFVTVTLDRAYGEVSLTIGFGPHGP